MNTRDYTPADRRPIASRNQPIWIRAAHWLASRNVRPNAISIAGMVAALVGGGALAAISSVHHPAVVRVLWLLAAMACQLRLVANMLDGMVALESNRASPVGELYNEVPDRVSDAAILIGLGLTPGAVPALGWLAALLAIFTAYVRATAKVAGAEQDYCGPMAKPHRMFLVTLACLYMAFAPGRGQPMLHGQWGIPAAVLALIVIGCLLTAIRRLRRAAARLRGGKP